MCILNFWKPKYCNIHSFEFSLIFVSCFGNPTKIKGNFLRAYEVYKGLVKSVPFYLSFN